jgi:Aspartyl protease
MSDKLQFVDENDQQGAKLTPKLIGLRTASPKSEALKMRYFHHLVVLAFIISCPIAAAADHTPFEIPFSYEKGHVIVKVTIKGAPAEVVLGTGAEYSMVDDRMVQKYKLPALYTGVGVVTGNNDRIVFFSTVDGINLGEIKGESLNMLSGSLRDIEKRIGREVFGIFGADFFKGRVVQFDFKNKVVRFLSKSPVIDQDKTPEPGRLVLSFVYDRRNRSYPIAEATFDGKKFETLFDTGTVTVVSLSASAAKELKLPAAEKNQTATGRVGVMRLNDFDVKDVPVVIYPSGSRFDTDEFDFRATAGVGFLQNFLSTFDFSKRVLILERN